MGGGKQGKIIDAILEIFDSDSEPTPSYPTGKTTGSATGKTTGSAPGKTTGSAPGKTTGSAPGKTTGSTTKSVSGPIHAPTIHPKPYFTISVTPSSESVRKPGNARYRVMVVSHNGFSNSVSLSTYHLPGGCKSSFSPNRVTPSLLRPRRISILTVRVSNSAVPIKYNFIVIGKWKTIFDAKNLEIEITK